MAGRLPDGQITFVLHVALSSPSRKNISLNPVAKEPFTGESTK